LTVDGLGCQSRRRATPPRRAQPNAAILAPKSAHSNPGAEQDCDVPALPPVVWKSDFFGTPAAFALLDGVVDVYLADFKFGNDACARRIAGVERYTEVVTRNLLLAGQQGDLIVRHLLLPGHHACCFVPLAEWLRAHLPKVKFSLRDGYLPRWRARQFAELAQPLQRGAAQPAWELAQQLGLNLIT